MGAAVGGGGVGADAPSLWRLSMRHTAFGRWAPAVPLRYQLAPYALIELPHGYVSALRRGGAIQAREGNRAFAPAADEGAYAGVAERREEEEEEEEECDDDDDEEHAPNQEMEELARAVDEAIASLGGEAVPKLMWSTPKDATWLTADGTLRCRSFDEVDLLIRASDNVAYDLSAPHAGCDDATGAGGDAPWTLALRAWRAVNPMLEFRCFVRDGELVAVSQRDASTHYDTLNALLAPDGGSALAASLRAFWHDKLKPHLPDALAHCAFDAYATPKSDDASFRIRAMDVNVFGPPTLPLLFDWEELNEASDGVPSSGDVAVRWVRDATHIRPGLKSALPLDLITSRGDESAGDMARRIVAES